MPLRPTQATAIVGAALILLTTTTAIATATATSVVVVSPSNCTTLQNRPSGNASPSIDCYDAFQVAASMAKASKASEIRLVSGAVYPVRCPIANRTSTTRVEAPAILLDNFRNLVFGAPDHHDQAVVQVDYVNGGCAGVVVQGGSNVTIRNVAVDAMRLPYTVGTLANVEGNGTRVLIDLEAPTSTNNITAGR